MANSLYLIPHARSISFDRDYEEYKIPLIGDRTFKENLEEVKKVMIVDMTENFTWGCIEDLEESLAEITGFWIVSSKQYGLSCIVYKFSPAGNDSEMDTLIKVSHAIYASFHLWNIRENPSLLKLRGLGSGEMELHGITNKTISIKEQLKILSELENG